MPTARNVKEEKNAKITIVRFETSTSPSWNDIRIFIRKIFLNLNTIAKNYSQSFINSKELPNRK